MVIDYLQIIMKYYRVKPEFDNYKMSKHYDIFIGNELFTENQKLKKM